MEHLAEGKPGHKPLGAYNLPRWVSHPELVGAGSIWDWRASTPLTPSHVDKSTAHFSEQNVPPARKVALLFPGQGSQRAGMLQRRAAERPEVAEMFAMASNVLGYDLLEICKDEDALEDTRYCQPALFVASVAALERFRSENPAAFEEIRAVAGLSLGEYAAFVAAGVFSFEDGLRLVQKRGEAMHTACVASKCGMLSIAGLSRKRVDELCVAAVAVVGDGESIAQVANELWPEGFVCAGNLSALRELRRLAEAAGAIQVRDLAVAGAFHTQLMEPASRVFARALNEVLPRMRAPRCAVFCNATGQALPAGCAPEEVAAALEAQMCAEVRWNSCLTEMLQECDVFYELGPGRQLRSIMRRVNARVASAMQHLEAQ